MTFRITIPATVPDIERCCLSKDRGTKYASMTDVIMLPGEPPLFVASDGKVLAVVESNKLPGGDTPTAPVAIPSEAFAVRKQESFDEDGDALHYWISQKIEVDDQSVTVPRSSQDDPNQVYLRTPIHFPAIAPVVPEIKPDTPCFHVDVNLLLSAAKAIDSDGFVTAYVVDQRVVLVPRDGAKAFAVVSQMTEPANRPRERDIEMVATMKARLPQEPIKEPAR